MVGLDTNVLIRHIVQKHLPRQSLPEAAVSKAEIIFEVNESPEGGYEARALGHSIFTQGNEWAELKTMAREAVLCHFAEDNAPRVIRLHLVREEAIAV